VVEAADVGTIEAEVVDEVAVVATIVPTCPMRKSLPKRCSMAHGLKRKATKKEPIS
jgi:hypothetical protein